MSLVFLNEETITDLSQSSAWRKRWHSVRVVDIRVDRGGVSHPGRYTGIMAGNGEVYLPSLREQGIPSEDRY